MEKKNKSIPKSILETQNKIETFLKLKKSFCVLGDVGTGKTEFFAELLKKKKIFEVPILENLQAWESSFTSLKKKTLLFENIHTYSKEKIDVLASQDFTKTQMIFTANPAVKVDTEWERIVTIVDPYSIFLKSLNVNSAFKFSELNRVLKDRADAIRRKVPTLHREVVDTFLENPLPRNYYDLGLWADMILAVPKNGTILLQDLPKSLLQKKNEFSFPLGWTFEAYEKEILLQNYEFFGRNKEKTAKNLNISSRNLFRKLKDYKIT